MIFTHTAAIAAILALGAAAEPSERPDGPQAKVAVAPGFSPERTATGPRPIKTTVVISGEAIDIEAQTADDVQRMVDHIEDYVCSGPTREHFPKLCSGYRGGNSDAPNGPAPEDVVVTSRKPASWPRPTAVVPPISGVWTDNEPRETETAPPVKATPKTRKQPRPTRRPAVQEDEGDGGDEGGSDGNDAPPPFSSTPSPASTTRKAARPKRPASATSQTRWRKPTATTERAPHIWTTPPQLPYKSPETFDEVEPTAAHLVDSQPRRPSCSPDVVKREELVPAGPHTGLETRVVGNAPLAGGRLGG